MWAQSQGFTAPYLPHASDALGYLRSTGNWTSAPGLMQTYIHHGPAQSLFLEALLSLPPQQAAQVCMCGGLDAVLLALRAHGYDPRLQASGCQAFTALVVAWNPFATHPAASASGISAAFYAVRSFGADAEVVEAALDLLAAVVRGSGPIAAMAASSAGGISDTLNALRAHAASSGVCRAACTAIAYMVVDSPAAQARAACVVGAVLDALRTHAAPATQEAAVWALCNCVDNCAANGGLARFIKGPQTVSRVLPTMSAEAAAQGLRFLALLGDGGGGEVVAAMRAHPEHSAVQSYGICALSALATREPERRAAEAAGARAAVETACAQHWGFLDATTRSQANTLQLKFFKKDAATSAAPQAAAEEKKNTSAADASDREAEPPVNDGPRCAATVAVPLSLPASGAAADAAVQFGTFDAAQHSGSAAPESAAVSGAAVSAAEDNSEHASPEMQAQLDALMPWLRLDSDSRPTPAAPPPPPAAEAAEPPATAQPPSATPAPVPAPAPTKAAMPAVRGVADEDRDMCVICLHERVCVALLPCRHFPTCAAPECAAMLGKPPQCPMCRLEVAERVLVAPPPPKAQPAALKGNAWKRGPPALGIAKEPPPPPACVGGCGAPPCTLFMPCRHLALCGDAGCAAKVAGGGDGGDLAGGKKRTRCPACRAEASAVLALFLL